MKIKPPQPKPAAVAASLQEIAGFPTSRLPPPVRADFVRLLSENFCYCGCPRTIAACLNSPSDCSCLECSRRMASFIEGLYMDGHSTQMVELELLEGFSEGYNGPAQSFDLSDQPALGPENAKYTIVEFADFQCAHCKAAFPELHRLLNDAPDTRLVYFYFPLGRPDGISTLAAEAAEEARLQGKFWELAKKMFQEQAPLDEAKIRSMCAAVGMNMKALETALQDHRHRARVLADKSVGKSVRVEATPTLFVNGRRLGMHANHRNLRMRLDMEGERGQCR